MLAERDPASMSKSSSVSGGERFYQRMYTVRALPLELLAGILPFYTRDATVAAIVAVSALVQLGDVAIGLGCGNMGMAVGAGSATVIHAMCAWSLL